MASKLSTLYVLGLVAETDSPFANYADRFEKRTGKEIARFLNNF